MPESFKTPIEIGQAQESMPPLEQHPSFLELINAPELAEGMHPAQVVSRYIESALRRPWEVIPAMREALKEQEIPDLMRMAYEGPINTEFGSWTMLSYIDKTAGTHHDVLVYGDFDGGSLGDGENVLTRVHSACRTNETFTATNCDCRPELLTSMKQIQEAGRGVIVYLDQEGRGNGEEGKLAQLAGMHEFIPGTNEARQRIDQGTGDLVDTVTAYEQAGYHSEIRDFEVAADILRDLGVRSVRLYANNPHKGNALEAHGIPVTERIEIHIPPANETQARDLYMKWLRHGHAMTEQDWTYLPEEQAAPSEPMEIVQTPDQWAHEGVRMALELSGGTFGIDYDAALEQISATAQGADTILVMDIDETIQNTVAVHYARYNTIYTQRGYPTEDLPTLDEVLASGGTDKAYLSYEARHPDQEPIYLKLNALARYQPDSQRDIPLLDEAIATRLKELQERGIQPAAYLTTRPEIVAEATRRALAKLGLPDLPIIARPIDVPREATTDWKIEWLQRIIGTLHSGQRAVMLDDSRSLYEAIGRQGDPRLVALLYNGPFTDVPEGVHATTWDTIVADAEAVKPKSTSRRRQRKGKARQ